MRHLCTRSEALNLDHPVSIPSPRSRLIRTNAIMCEAHLTSESPSLDELVFALSQMQAELPLLHLRRTVYRDLPSAYVEAG